MTDLLENLELLYQLPGYIYIKGTDSRYLACNNEAASWLDLKHPQEIVGKNTSDIPLIKHLSKFFLEQDRRTLQAKRETEMLVCVHDINKKLFIGHNIQKPLYSSNKLVGTAGFCFELSSAVLEHINKFLLHEIRCHGKNASCYLIQEAMINVELTKRESECLFYLMRGKSAREIAELLFLSRRTVETYLDSCKAKMNCNNKSSLIEKAISCGLLYTIPKALMSEQKAVV